MLFTVCTYFSGSPFDYGFRKACNGMQHAVESWRISCVLLEIYMYSPQSIGKMHLQNGSNLWLVWSNGVMESPVPKTW